MNKIKKTYHDNDTLNEEYEVNEEGAKNGYYKLFHDNGQLKVETSFKNGIQNPGTIISYHNNGVKAREVILSKNGKFNGAVTEWYDNGILKLESTYNDGRIAGVYKTWDSFGNLKQDYVKHKLFDILDLEELDRKEIKEVKVNWLQDIAPIYQADDYMPYIFLHHPKTKNDGEYIMLLCGNKEEAIAIIDYIIELNGGKDKFFKHKIEDWSHVFSGHLFYIRYRNELFGDYVIVELNRREERKFVSFNDKNEILHGIHKDSKKINSMIDGLNSIVYNSGEMTSGGGHLYYTASESHIVSYWDDLEKVINKFKSIVDCYSENAISENLIGSHKEISDFTYENLKGIINKKDFFLSLKTDEFTINLSKGTSSYQMNFYFNKI